MTPFRTTWVAEHRGHGGIAAELLLDSLIRSKVEGCRHSSHYQIFCLSEEGTTYVVKAGAEFELLGKNVLGDVALATPAVADGRLFIRTATSLYCIQKPANSGAKKP